MALGDTTIADGAMELIAEQTLDWVNDDIEAMLVEPSVAQGGSGTWDPSAGMTFLDIGGSDPAANECSGTGYSRKDLASQAITLASNKIQFDANDLVWSSINVGDVGYCVIYDNAGGADSANRIIAAIDLDASTTNGGDLTVRFASNGVFYFAPNS
jgi:hypothetical protein